VVAAAVMFKSTTIPRGLDDSKRLSPERRCELYDVIRDRAWIGVGIISVDDIDRLNILQATLRAMAESIAGLSSSPDVVLIDGNCAPPVSHRAVPVVEGDQRCPSIAAASIIAKVTRDRLMEKLSEDFPAYGWHSNKGYGTRAHASAIAEHGITSHHRRSFAPIRAALLDGSASRQPPI
jgi:ribonuclease HII